MAYQHKDRGRKGLKEGSLWPQELGAQQWWGAGQEGGTRGEDAGFLSPDVPLQILISRRALVTLCSLRTVAPLQSD